LGKISKQELSSGLKAEIESKAKQEDLASLEQGFTEHLDTIAS